MFKQPGRTGGHGAVGVDDAAELVMLDVVKVVPGALVASWHLGQYVFVEVTKRVEMVFVTSMEVELPTIFVFVTGHVVTVVSTSTVVTVSAGELVVLAAEVKEEVGGV